MPENKTLKLDNLPSNWGNLARLIDVCAGRSSSAKSEGRTLSSTQRSLKALPSFFTYMNLLERHGDGSDGKNAHEYYEVLGKRQTQTQK